MNKSDFLVTLRSELERQSISNIDNMIEYYDEMICDRIEDGMTEEEAVGSMDSIEEIVKEAVLDKSVPALVREKVQKSREKAKSKGHEWIWITLAVLGFPVWFPILLTVIILLFVFFMVFWILVATVFIVLLGIGFSAIACLVAAFTVFFGLIPFPTFLLAIGAALALGGICVLLWKPLVAFAKAAGKTFGKIIVSIKKKIA